MTHNFQDSLNNGLDYERKLDLFYSQFYQVYTVDIKSQRLGIDRLWKHKIENQFYSVEYKTDFRAAETGNLFVETVGDKEGNRPGWAYYSIAQLLIYFIPGKDVAYRFEMSRLKGRLPEWEETLRKVSLQSKKGDKVWTTEGLLLPLSEVWRYCFYTDKMDGWRWLKNIG
jgi:hypothetical protein